MKNNAKTRTASLFGIALFLAALIFNFTACSNNNDPDIAKPAAPSGLKAGEITKNSIEVLWDSMDGVSGYTVYAGTDSGNLSRQGTPTDASFKITELKVGTNYYIAVSATNVSGEGDQSSPITATTALDWSKIADYDAADGDRILGTATAEFLATNGQYQETVLGNCIMDGIAEYARYVSGEEIDFALHNDSFVRGAITPKLPAGELSNSTVLGLSGTDTLVVATFTGKQVKDVIEGFVKSTSTGSWNRKCAPTVSKEVSYTITSTTTETMAVTNIKVNGTPIDESKEYRIAGGNFILDNTNATRFFPVLDAEKKIKYAPTTLAQAFAMYVLAKGTLDPADYPLGRYTGVVPE
jgi:hypothetical protein